MEGRAEEQAEPSKPSLAERLREQRARHKDRHIIVRAAFVVAGFTLLVAGIAMLALPGPAFAVIPIAFGLLSLEFLWAERMMEKALEQADKAKAKAARTSRTQRLLIGAVTACAIAAAVTAALVWDIPYLPV
jgi:uncharacterized protein (TIGR02611 family)